MNEYTICIIKNEEGLMGNIFYGEREQRDFNNPKKYAFMNWRFGNGEGCNDKNDNR